MSRVTKTTRKSRWNLPGDVSPVVIAELSSILSGMDGFKAKYLREEILSKYLDPSVVPPEERAHAAVTKWLLAEQKNSNTNERLYMAQAIEPDFGWSTFNVFVRRCRRKVQWVLGPLPDILADAEISNGASTRVGRQAHASLLKLKGEMHVSESALNHFLEYWVDKTLYPNGWKKHSSSTMFTVEKKSDIDRVACKEPEGNMLLQRICGKTISQRLRRKTGIDLRDQSRNRRLARSGSHTGDLATIDLSSASDLISSGLVQLLLPTDWWSLLDDLRVKHVKIPAAIAGTPDDVSHELAMFSSMGNGFTFELESLLFWAIVKTIQELSGSSGIVSVYGDDIICSSELVPRVNRMFEFLGFTMNLKKTNYGARNKFRESCGGHYYDGFDVTPFYIRGPLVKITDLIKLLNQLLDWDGRGWGFFLTPELAEFHLKWSRQIPKRFHGAVDCSEIGSLVTGVLPRSTIVPITAPINVDHLEEERFLLNMIDLERFEGSITKVGPYWLYNRGLSPVSVKLTGAGKIICSTNTPVKVVGFKASNHPEKGTGVRTTYDPYILLDLSTRD